MARTIYVVRNPKDVLVSYFTYFSSTSSRFVTMSQFGPNFLNGKVAWGSWFEHLRSWWPHRHDARTLFIQYNDLCDDLLGVVRRVDTFCGLGQPEAKLREVAARCKITYMMQHQEKFDPRLFVYRSPRTLPARFIRDGGVGTHRNELPVSLDADLDARVRSVSGELDGLLDTDDGRFLTSPRRWS